MPIPVYGLIQQTYFTLKTRFDILRKLHEIQTYMIYQIRNFTFCFFFFFFVCCCFFCLFVCLFVCFFVVVFFFVFVFLFCFFCFVFCSFVFFFFFFFFFFVFCFLENEEKSFKMSSAEILPGS